MSTPVAVTGLAFNDDFSTFSASANGEGGTWMTNYTWGGEAAVTLPSNNEAQYYSSDLTGPNCPFSLSNGNLNISAFPVSNGWYGLPYCSGLITTARSFFQTYGYFEIRCKLPKGRGLWPAWWMYNDVPTDGTELDIFEVLGHDMMTLHFTTHGPGGVGQSFAVPDMSADFHVYGCDWNPTSVTLYLDGVEIGSAPTPSSMCKPMFMLLNITVGAAGSWPGPPDASTVFPATMEIDYVRAYSTAATTFIGGPAALTPTTPAPAPAITTIGSGPDTLVLVMCEDAWLGDACFTVSLDGTQVGGTQTVTATNAANATQEFRVKGFLMAGQHTCTVNFINDAYGGSPTTDRNLFVRSASLNGIPLPNSALGLYAGGPQSFTFTATRTDPDTLTIQVAEDAYQGDAQFTVKIDGVLLGTYTATASHTAGLFTEQVITGSWGAGAHEVEVAFVNDAYGGPGLDRNLYVSGIGYNGIEVQIAPGTLLSNGTIAVLIAPASAVSKTLTLHLCEDAWQGDAEFTVAIDGVPVGGAMTVTALRSAGATQAFPLKLSLLPGLHHVAVSFINDAYGGTASTDRNLFIRGADLDGAALGWTADLYSNGTSHFPLVVS